jgi:hypothetical protein
MVEFRIRKSRENIMAKPKTSVKGIEAATASEGAAGLKSSVAPSASAPQPKTPVEVKDKRNGKGKDKEKGKAGRTKRVDKQPQETSPEAAVPRKAIILIKVLTNEIEAKKAKIAKHKRKLERLERALRELLVKYNRD